MMCITIIVGVVGCRVEMGVVVEGVYLVEVFFFMVLSASIIFLLPAHIITPSNVTIDCDEKHESKAKQRETSMSMLRCIQ